MSRTTRAIARSCIHRVSALYQEQLKPFWMPSNSLMPEFKMNPKCRMVGYLLSVYACGVWAVMCSKHIPSSDHGQHSLLFQLSDSVTVRANSQRKGKKGPNLGWPITPSDNSRSWDPDYVALSR